MTTYFHYSFYIEFDKTHCENDTSSLFFIKNDDET